MYNREDLLNIRKAFRLVGAEGMSIEILEAHATEFSEKFGVSLAWETDQIDNGGGAIQDCLVLFNPDHKDDYFKIVVDFEMPSMLAALSASITGESANGINRAGAVALMQGGKMALANLAGGNTETGSPEDCAAEKDDYVSMYDIVNALIGAGEV